MARPASDAEEIENIGAHLADIAFRARIIRARSADGYVRSEVEGILDEVRKAKDILSPWWEKARRRALKKA